MGLAMLGWKSDEVEVDTSEEGKQLKGVKATRSLPEDTDAE